jgi:1-pyrroline-5-carboxylate dehydrogenase
LINGEKITLEKKFESINPAKNRQIVGVFSDADRRCGKSCQAGDLTRRPKRQSWRNVSAEERPEFLFRAAHIVRG